MATMLQRFWYLLTQLGWKDKHLEMLKRYGVTSFKNIGMVQQEELVNELQEEWNSRSQRPRGTVIHYLCIMPGYNYQKAGRPDYEKINQWVASKFNGKNLNQLSLSELNTAVTAVKQWYRKQLKQ